MSQVFSSLGFSRCSQENEPAFKETKGPKQRHKQWVIWLAESWLLPTSKCAIFSVFSAFGQSGPFCSACTLGMRSWKTELKHRFRIRSRNEEGLFPKNEVRQLKLLQLKSNEKMHLVFPNEIGGEYVHNKIQILLQKIQHQKVEVPGTTESTVQGTSTSNSFFGGISGCLPCSSCAT